MKRRNYSIKDLRKFGLIIIAYFLLVTLMIARIYHKNPYPSRVWLLIMFCLSFILFQPIILLPFKMIFDYLLRILHWVNMRILLGIIYFFVFSPVALFRKLLKNDVLRLSKMPVTTYREFVDHDKNDVRRPY